MSMRALRHGSLPAALADYPVAVEGDGADADKGFGLVVGCYFFSPVCCLLSIACCLISAVCCLLSIVSYWLPHVYCLLSIVCCLMSAFGCLPVARKRGGYNATNASGSW
jgi:hypothetical protein